MHPNDRQDRLVSKHPGSKTHKRGKSLRQKHRDGILRLRKSREAKVRTVAMNSGRLIFNESSKFFPTGRKMTGAVFDETI